MSDIIKRLLACLLTAAMLITMLGTFAFADAEESDQEPDAEVETEEREENPADDPEVEPANDVSDEEDETSPEEPADESDGDAEPDTTDETGEDENSEEEEDETEPMITDQQAISNCLVAAENDRFILYYDEGLVAEEEGDDPEPTMERIGLYDKQSGVIDWVTPINALSDTSTNKASLKKNRMSSLAYKYGNATDLITSSAFLYSYRECTENGNTKMEPETGGLKVTYSLRTAGATVPVHYELQDDGLYVYIDTVEINERNGYKEDIKDDTAAETDTIVLIEIAMTPYMGAATEDDEGYMFVPDGSGAIIELNNGKGNYADYSQDIYGRDITQVKEIEPDQGEQAYLPVMAMVKGSHGLVMIATDGDTFSKANANVSYSKQENSWYNNCYFSFTLRSTDDYYMTGDSSAITVYEKGDGTIGVPRIGVKYVPITGVGDEVTVTEIADVYRDYLINEKGLSKKDSATDPALYVDFYGGTLKAKSILGFPINLKTAYTSFSDATDIVSFLKENGVDNIVVNYNDWSNDSMSKKLDTGDSIARCLGGKGAYDKMLKSFGENGVDYYASVSGLTFKSSGNGFWTLFDTSYRVSKSYSRQYTYNIAYGTPDSGVAAALMAPRSISKLSKKVTKNLSKFEQGAGLGEISTTLWSDFSNKNRTNRNVTAENIIEYYKAAAESCGKVIADSPNAYIIPYVDRIENLTLQSSQFKVTDYDVPFYQIVMHGYVDYASEAVNGTPDTKIAVLKAIAAGSNIHFDFIHNEASELVNTDYVNLFYACYDGWLGEAAGAYKLVDEVLSGAKDATISDYIVDGKTITTTYSNGYKTVVDLDAGTVSANGKIYNYTEYIKGGLK